MRRVLLGGISLTLGLSTGPAWAQSPASRSASLGRPVAMAERPTPPIAHPGANGPVDGYDPNESGVTPAGLFSRRPANVSTSQQMTFNPVLIPSVRPPGQASPFPPAPTPTPTGTPNPTPLMTTAPGIISSQPLGSSVVPGQPIVTTGPTIVSGPTVLTSPAQAPAQGLFHPGTPVLGGMSQPLPGIPGTLPTQSPNSPPAPMPMPSTPGSSSDKPAAGPSVTEVRDPQPLPKPTPLVPGAVMVNPGGTMPGMVDPAIPFTDAPVEDPFCGPGCDKHGCFDRLRGIFGGGVFVKRPGPARYWLSTEYLGWWVNNPGVPVLATTSLVPGQDGFLGQPGTVAVLGGVPAVGTNPLSGFRVGLGWWFNDCQTCGVDARFFFLQDSAGAAGVTSGLFPLLTRPFFNLNDNIPFGETVAFPGFAAGAVLANFQSSVWGAEVNFRKRLCLWDHPCARLDGLVGFRYLNLKDQFNVDEGFIRTGQSVPAVGLQDVVAGLIQDRFRTENNFYGAQIGFTGEIRKGRWFLDTRATIAFGSTTQAVEIYGAQNLLTANGGWIQSEGGLLALPGSNIGKFSQSRFAVLPEVGVNLGYHITPHLRAFIGYNLLYLSNVLRAPDVVDTNIDVTRIPNFPLSPTPSPYPVPRPAPQFRTSDWVAQGINFGLAYTW